jgi:hypothetical protein
MSKTQTQTLATIILGAFAFSQSLAWGQTPVMRELSATAPTATPVELATEPVTMGVPMRSDARAQVEAAIAPASKTALALTVDETVSQTPDVTYEVYINLPKNEEPNYKSIHFVGNLAPFLPRAGAHEHPYVASFDITKNVRELKSMNLWNDAELSVTFVMRGLVDREGRQLPVPAGVRGRVSNLKVAAIAAQ